MTKKKKTEQEEGAIVLSDTEAQALIASEVKRLGVLWGPGDTVIDDSNDYRKIVGFEVKPGWDKNGHHKDPYVVVHYTYWARYSDGTVKETKSQSVLDEIVGRPYNHDWLRVDGDPSELAENAYAELRKAIADFDKSEQQINQGAGAELALRTTPSMLEATRERIQEQQNRIVVMQRIVARETANARALMDSFQEKISYLNKVIEVGSLYLGLEEEVTVVREGMHAAPGVPLTLMQRLLYMDEEVGVVNLYQDKPWGIDFDSIDKFDEWVLEDNHLDLLIPAEKGIVLMKPARKTRDYSQNPWENMLKNQWNKQIYVLIRNGEAVYRLWVALEGIKNRMFPTQGEWQNMLHLLAGEEMEFQDEHYDPKKMDYVWETERRKPSESERKNASEVEFQFKKTVALLQGILDRTECVQPMPHAINLFDPTTYQNDEIVFIRDAEPSIKAPGEPYAEWKARLAKQITKGSRIYLGPYDEYYGGERKGRFLVYMNWYPAGPPEGVYEVEEVGSPDSPYDRMRNNNALRILYNPGDTVYDTSWSHYDFDGHKRKMRLSYLLERNQKNVLNYDLIDPADIDRFIQDRTERGNYMDMLPVLYSIKKAREAELEREAHFVTLVASRTGKPEEDVWEAVRWWKLRNKYKRGLSKDDAKAMRMIERKLRGAWAHEEV